VLPVDDVRKAAAANRFAFRENPAPEMVNTGLTDRVPLRGFGETLQQSLSGNSRGQKLMPPWGFADVVARCFNSVRPKGIAPVPS
jgi:hypothetical protein